MHLIKGFLNINTQMLLKCLWVQTDCKMWNVSKHVFKRTATHEEEFNTVENDSLKF